MKENDIRPDRLKEAQQKYIAEDIAFLQSRAGSFSLVNCPACTLSNNDALFDKEGFSYLQCSGCGMLYMNPRPTKEILSEFYHSSPNYKFFNDHIFPASIEQRRVNIFIPRVQKVINLCKQHRIECDKILEVGAGFGLFCEEMAKTGYFTEIVAVEASESLYDTASSRGFRVYQGILEDLTIDEQFSAVVSFEVIEHIADPLEHLSRIQYLLQPGGLLVLTFPNYDGFDIAVLGKHSESIDHEHLNYFNERSIRGLMERCGMEVLGIETPGLLDVELVRKKIQEGEYDPPGYIRNICIDHYEKAGPEFQDFLRQNNLSSHMLVAARKIRS